MKKFNTYFLAIIITNFIGFFLCDLIYHQSDLKNNNSLTQIRSNISHVTKNPFVISDSITGFKFKTLNNFNFLISNANLIKPLPKDLLTGISQLKDNLLKNTSQILNISGFYKSSEKNNTKLSNLGLARAKSIKTFLTSFGFPKDRINYTSKLNDTIIEDANNILYGPLSFYFSKKISNKNNNEIVNNLPNNKNILKDKTKLKQEKNKIISNLLKNNKEIKKESTFIFDYAIGESYKRLSYTNRQKLITICKAIKGTNLKIYIVGHTDSMGKPHVNFSLGKKRANYIKNKMLLYGVLSKNIKTFSKGETEPIANNATEAGRSKNRRTVITIKE